ncbi:hypothetical protein [Nitrospira sp. BLG_1]|uniref:hypothetical protein n=1 Tax=Nitrospira sp. BLG_1 TaxID=3395883 RepID=UPI0039BC3AE3
MDRLVWTRERPTVPGWYWYRDMTTVPRVVSLIQDGYGLVVYGIEEYCNRLYEVRGEWAGPIPPPEEPCDEAVV